jgi:very-short-patch-repair endonuclease
LLWRHLRNRQLSGYKFRRQYPVGFFIVDFCCPEKNLIIEIDGGQHSWQVESDNLRSSYLEGKGFRVLRFWNNQVMRELGGVLGIIFAYLEETPPHPDPLPQVGEG